MARSGCPDIGTDGAGDGPTVRSSATPTGRRGSGWTRQLYITRIIDTFLASVKGDLEPGRIDGSGDGPTAPPGAKVRPPPGTPTGGAEYNREKVAPLLEKKFAAMPVQTV
jgi:hypothetical protein